jgi:hypothetical protein
MSGARFILVSMSRASGDTPVAGPSIVMAAKEHKEHKKYPDCLCVLCVLSRLSRFLFCYRFPIILLAALALPGFLGAQESVPLPACTTGRLVQIVLPGAACSAVSDTLKLAVFGHPGPGDHQLTLVPLDDSGNVGSGPAWRLTPAKPEALTPFALSTLDLAFHPTLPLLYVWRDVVYPFSAKPPARQTVFDEFKHLTIYAVGNRMLTPVGSFARGSDYTCGNEFGRLAMDPRGRRLFLPNICRGKEANGIGYLPIASNGLPLVEENGEAKLVRVVLPEAGEESTGKGLACFNEQVACVGVPNGVLVWDTGNRLGAVSVVRLFNWPPGSVFLGAHPAVPAFYMALRSTIGMVAAADGYPTLLPRTLDVPGGAFTAAPVVLPAAPAVVAFASANAVYLRGIDPATGAFTGNDSVTAVTNPTVRTLSTSARWNRLYVPVEALP